MPEPIFPKELSCFNYNQTPGVALFDDLRPECPKGFFCPNSTSKNFISSPRLCPASNECGLKRLMGFPCEAQGPFEPVICEEGFYCEDQYTKKDCPPGFYCPIGTFKPLPCVGVVTRCPKGSSKCKLYDSLLCLIAIDIILIACYYYIKFSRAKKTKRNDMARTSASTVGGENKKDLEIGEHLEDSGSEQTKELETGAKVTSKLLDFFKRGLNGRIVKMEFKFDNMGLKLPKSGKILLQGVSGEIKSSRMTAIMGPSGAGKTTFMNVLCGKVSRTSGTLEVSGKPAEIHHFKKMIGYVPQEDTMIRDLTVRNILMHSARIRLPRQWNDEEKKEYVTTVIESLNLAHVQDVNIGDEGTRGISGGQRKRVNIGIELCAIPTCIFLDEPTSGLDSTAALEVCDNLRQIAALGLTIVSVIHQPRIEIFEKFHDVFLIAPGGQTAFLGPIEECQPYFESHGYYFDPRVNPADVLMDILSGKGVNEKNSYTSNDLVKLWALKKSLEASEQAKENAKNGEKLDALTISQSQKSEIFHSTVPDLIKERGAGFFIQMYHCHQRSLMQQYAGVSTFVLECATSIFAGGVIALSVQSQPYIYRGLYNKPLTLLSPASMDWLVPLMSFLLGMIITLAAAPAAVAVFSEERTNYFREASSGHNKLAYFSAKILTSFYRLSLACLHFCVPFHVIVNPTIGFSKFYLMIWVLYVGIYGVSHTVSMLVPRENASLFAVLLCLIQTATAGFGISQAKAEKVYHVGWLFNMSFFRWITEILWTESVEPFRHIYMVDASAEYWGLTMGRVWVDYGFAFAIGWGWRIGAFILMVNVHKEKQR